MTSRLGRSIRGAMALALCAAGLVVATSSPVHAQTSSTTTVSFPTTVQVGDTGVPASLTLTNTNTFPDEFTANVICDQNDPACDADRIKLTPSCLSTDRAFCSNNPDTGVFALSFLAEGRVGSACEGVDFDVIEVDPTIGTVEFLPRNLPIVVLPGESCVIDFTFDVLRVPTFDAGPSPEVDTFQIASHTQRNGAQSGSSSSLDRTTVLPADGIETIASASVAVGGQLTDLARVNGRINPLPGATVTFTLYGPDDATCANAPVFTSTVGYPVGGGYVTSAAYTATTAGTYRWIASYDNDANNVFPSGACNDPNESTVVTRAQPTIATIASPDILLGAGSLADTATLSGLVNPVTGAGAGTVTFRLYGPSDPTCSTAAVFISSNRPYALPNGPATSALFTPSFAGTYRWIAEFSGDANNAPVSGLCNDANETVVVATAQPVIATVASADFALGAGSLTDQATVTGRVNPQPGATVTFRLYGPNDPTCTTVVFSSVVPYPVAGGPVTSGSRTPSVPGTYRWIATYDGDANNAGVTGLCTDPAEDTVVAPAQPTISTDASDDVVLGGGPLTDRATVLGRVNGQPGATVTFRLYGPGDLTCAGAPVFTSANVPQPVVHGPVDSLAFTPTAAGTYRWIASYSGDTNNDPAAGACNDPAETVIVARAQPSISTTASATVTVGSGSLTDTAVVSGRIEPLPGATVSFALHGPDDATCASPPVFVSAPIAYPVGGGPVTSPAFTPTQPGMYRWVAAYSGDANNAAIAAPCNAPGENVTVSPTSTTTTTTTAPTTTTAATTTTTSAPATTTTTAPTSAPTDPSVTGATAVQPGSAVTFDARNLCAGAMATFELTGAGGARSLGGVTTDASGGASLSTASPTAPGTYAVTASTNSSGCSLSASFGFTVLAPLNTIAGGLPTTGSDSTTGLTIAVVLLLAGLAFVTVAARRRTRTGPA